MDVGIQTGKIKDFIALKVVVDKFTSKAISREMRKMYMWLCKEGMEQP